MNTLSRSLVALGTAGLLALAACGGDDATPCPGRLAGELPAGWRYRAQEIAVPLRNQIWAARP